MSPRDSASINTPSNDSILTSVHSSSIEEGSLIENKVLVPHDNDVLCGRGGYINIHPGNSRFRRLVEKRKRCYIDARFKREKRLITESIIKDIKRQMPPGRFLTRPQKDGPWIEISEDKARDKTSQALRENAPKIRKQIQSEIDDRNSKWRIHGRGQGTIYSMQAQSQNYYKQERQQYHPTGHQHSHHADEYFNERDRTRQRPYDCFSPQSHNENTGSNNWPHYNCEKNVTEQFGCPGRHVIENEHPAKFIKREKLRPTRVQSYECFSDQYEPNDFGLPSQKLNRNERQYDPNYSGGFYTDMSPPQCTHSGSHERGDRFRFREGHSTNPEFHQRPPSPQPIIIDQLGENVIKNFVNWGSVDDSHEMLALMDSLSMEDDDRRTIPDVRTPPPQEENHEIGHDWSPVGSCHDIMKRTFFRDDACGFYANSMDMDDHDDTGSAWSLSGPSLVNVFEESSKSIKESVMSFGDSFFSLKSLSKDEKDIKN